KASSRINGARIDQRKRLIARCRERSRDDGCDGIEAAGTAATLMQMLRGWVGAACATLANAGPDRLEAEYRRALPHPLPRIPALHGMRTISGARRASPTCVRERVASAPKRSEAHEPGEGAFHWHTCRVTPSPALASLGHPLPQGERVTEFAARVDPTSLGPALGGFQ